MNYKALFFYIMYTLPTALAKTAAKDMTKYNLRTNAKFLAEVEKQKGIYKTSSGLLIEIIKKNSDRAVKGPNFNEEVVISFNSTLRDGSVIEVAHRTRTNLQKVVPAVYEALQLMVEGDKWRIWISPDIGYGEAGLPPKIPPSSIVIFEIELHKVYGIGKRVAAVRETFDYVTSNAMRIIEEDKEREKAQERRERGEF